MNTGLRIFWELVFVIVSVLVFRSSWMLMDRALGSRGLWLLFLVQGLLYPGLHCIIFTANPGINAIFCQRYILDCDNS